MKFIETELPGVVVVEPEMFEDARGLFMETFHRDKYASGGIDRIFVQDNYSYSVQGTLRGLHYQFPRLQAKLVYVLSGEIYDVAVDIRRDSPSFRRWIGITLSAENRRQVFVPEGFAHGFCVISKFAQVLYKCTDFYHPEHDRGILWADPSLRIRWPIREPLLSPKDARLPMLETGITLKP